MPLRPLAAVVLLAVADWGIWIWSISANHSTLSLLAGLLMAPLFVALLWLATMTASTVARAAAGRLLSAPRPVHTRPPQPDAGPPEQEQRLAA